MRVFILEIRVAPLASEIASMPFGLVRQFSPFLVKLLLHAPIMFHLLANGLTGLVSFGQICSICMIDGTMCCC